MLPASIFCLANNNKQIPFAVPSPQTAQCLAQRAAQRPSQRSLHVAKSDNGRSNLGDELLDFMYAGKKLRKWYGQEGQVLPRDGGGAPEESPEPEDDAYDGPCDQILVLDADTCVMAEQVLLQLILLRPGPIKVTAKDTATTRSGFGPYLSDAVQMSSGGQDAGLLRKACRGVRAVVVCGATSAGALAAVAAAGVAHVVLLSAVGAPPSGGFLFKDREMAVLEDARREAAVKSSGLAFTIVRVGRLVNSEGGASRLELQGGSAPGGGVCREDAAVVLARAAAREVAAGQSLELSLAAAGPGQPPEDWDREFDRLIVNNSRCL